MKRWKQLCGLTAAIAVLAGFGAFGLAVYFGESMPTAPEPAMGRVRTYLYHSRTVYLTIWEDRLLIGLFVIAVLAFAALALIDRRVDPSVDMVS